MASEAWYEDGWWWKEDQHGNLYYKDGRRWKRFEQPTVWQAAGEAAYDTAQMAWLSALIAYAGVKKVKSMI